MFLRILIAILTLGVIGGDAYAQCGSSAQPAPIVQRLPAGVTYLRVVQVVASDDPRVQFRSRCMGGPQYHDDQERQVVVWANPPLPSETGFREVAPMIIAEMGRRRLPLVGARVLIIGVEKAQTLPGPVLEQLHAVVQLRTGYLAPLLIESDTKD